MAEFADRMKSFTGHLRDSIHMRGEALSQVQAATGELLDGARTFLENVAGQHRARAEELHATLTTHRKECQQTVAEMRHSHQDSLRKMRDDLNHTLSETRKTRQDTVNQLRESFQHARNELASDLREASSAWRQFTAGRDEHVASSVSEHPEHAHDKPAHAVKHRSRVHHKKR